MKELSIVNRMAAFIEHVHQSTGVLPANIVITQAQLDELKAETDKHDDKTDAYLFWGVPLIVSEDKDGQAQIESH